MGAVHPSKPSPPKGHLFSSQGASGQYLYDRSGPTPPFSIRLNLGSPVFDPAWTMGVDGWSKRFTTQMLAQQCMTTRAARWGRAINASSTAAKCATGTGLDFGVHGPTPRVETATFSPGMALKRGSGGRSMLGPIESLCQTSETPWPFMASVGNGPRRLQGRGRGRAGGQKRAGRSVPFGATYLGDASGDVGTLRRHQCVSMAAAKVGGFKRVMQTLSVEDGAR